MSKGKIKIYLPLRYEVGDIVDAKGRKLAELIDSHGDAYCSDEHLADEWGERLVKVLNNYVEDQA